MSTAACPAGSGWRIERHADLCPECGPLRRTLVRMTAALRELRRHSTPSIAPKVIRRLRESDREHPSGPGS